jgi:hypothetical protein
VHGAADKDRDEIQHQTELQERALDGIDSALDDLEVMSKVHRPPRSQRAAAEGLQICDVLQCVMVLPVDRHICT